MIRIAKIEFGYHRSKHCTKLLVFQVFYEKIGPAYTSSERIVHKYIAWNDKYDYAKCYPSKVHALTDAKKIYTESEKSKFQKPLDTIEISGLKLKYISDEIDE